jgi:hypothetical protein
MFQALVSPVYERWAEALAIERQHGGAAPKLFAERETTLAQAGDEQGGTRWIDIAAKFDALIYDGRQRH